MLSFFYETGLIDSSNDKVFCEAYVKKYCAWHISNSRLSCNKKISEYNLLDLQHNQKT